MPKHLGLTEGEFSVAIFFEDGSSAYVRAWVDPREAVQAFRQMTHQDRPINTLGLIQRVIITDGGDCTCMEWIQGKGITFPSPEQLENAGEG